MPESHVPWPEHELGHVCSEQSAPVKPDEHVHTPVPLLQVPRDEQAGVPGHSISEQSVSE